MDNLELYAQRFYSDPSLDNKIKLKEQIFTDCQYILRKLFNGSTGRHLIDDVLGCICLKLDRIIEGYKIGKGCTMTSYLYQISRRTMLDYIRSQNRYNKHIDRFATEEDVESITYDDVYFQHDLSLPVADIPLTSSEMEILYLVYRDGYSLSDLSKHLNLTKALSYKTVCCLREKLSPIREKYENVP